MTVKQLYELFKFNNEHDAFVVFNKSGAFNYAYINSFYTADLVCDAVWELPVCYFTIGYSSIYVRVEATSAVDVAECIRRRDEKFNIMCGGKKDE